MTKTAHSMRFVVFSKKFYGTPECCSTQFGQHCYREFLNFMSKLIILKSEIFFKNFQSLEDLKIKGIFQKQRTQKMFSILWKTNQIVSQCLDQINFPNIDVKKMPVHFPRIKCLSLKIFSFFLIFLHTTNLQ